MCVCTCERLYFDNADVYCVLHTTCTTYTKIEYRYIPQLLVARNSLHGQNPSADASILGQPNMASVALAQFIETKLSLTELGNFVPQVIYELFCNDSLHLVLRPELLYHPVGVDVMLTPAGCQGLPERHTSWSVI